MFFYKCSLSRRRLHEEFQAQKKSGAGRIFKRTHFEAGFTWWKETIPQGNVTPLKDQLPRELCGSGRIVKQLERYIGLREFIQTISNDSDNDPCNYKKAIEDIDTSQ